jgi:hypothetical protein
MATFNESVELVVQNMVQETLQKHLYIRQRYFYTVLTNDYGNYARSKHILYLSSN